MRVMLVLGSPQLIAFIKISPRAMYAESPRLIWNLKIDLFVQRYLTAKSPQS